MLNCRVVSASMRLVQKSKEQCVHCLPCEYKGTEMGWNAGRVTLLVTVLVGVTAYFAADLGSMLSLEGLRGELGRLHQYQAEAPSDFLLYFIGIYAALSALYLPGAIILSVAAGVFFGGFWGVVIASLASTLGATLAFFVSRHIVAPVADGRLGESLRFFNQGIERDGAYHLFFLRMVPIFPYFLVNLAMGLTSIKLKTYVLVSFIGMLPATSIFVSAGTQFSELTSLEGLVTPATAGLLTLFGALPFIARRLMHWRKGKALYAQWPKPSKFDRNVVVIGAGSAGLVTSYIAAAVKAKVTLIERDKMGGDCLNTGCVPSKALIRSAKVLAHARRAEELGFKKITAEFDFADVMERVQRIVKTVEPHDSVERYSSLGVDCVIGEAKITSPWTVQVGDQVLTTKNIVIATGARPTVPPIKGLDQIDYLTSDNVWDLRELPKRMVVLGGGPIGSELAQCFCRFGAEVTQVQRPDRILPKEDPEVSEHVKRCFEREGMQVLVKHSAREVVVEKGEKILICEHAGQEVRIPFDALLIAIGRTARIEGFGLEELGIQTSQRGTVDVNDYLQTKYPNIFACGDVCSPFQFTHTAAHQAWYASVNALFGFAKKFRVDYSVIPWATFTDPEVARVGLNEFDAKEQGIEYDVTTFDLEELDRAIADEEAHGLVKVLTKPGKGEILGATIMGEHAGDYITEFVAAMRHGFGMEQILGTIHIYPTLGEANKYAAGNWKKANAPEGLLRWVAKLHKFNRGGTEAYPDPTGESH